MYYKKIIPPPHLQPYIECFYIWEVHALNQFIVESPPSAFGSMVFNYGQRYRIQNPKYDSVIAPQFFLTGQATHTYQLNLSGQIGMVGIVFRPAAMYTLFNLPVAELTNERLPIGDILRGVKIRDLQDKIEESPSNQARIALLIQFLTLQLMQNEHRFDTVDFAANRIVTSNGMVNVNEMMTDLFMCRRQFERKFFQKVGLSPKFYARTRRLGYLCSLMSGKREVNWQSLFFDCGYYDQAHFIKEFTTFLGRTPTDYLKNNVELTHFLKNG
jgi:AraC-like DNA-binding protein